MRRKPLAAIAIAALAVTAFAACGDDDDDDTPTTTTVVGGDVGVPDGHDDASRRVDRRPQAEVSSTASPDPPGVGRRCRVTGVRPSGSPVPACARGRGGRRRGRRPGSRGPRPSSRRSAPRSARAQHDAGDAGGVGPGDDRLTERQRDAPARATAAATAMSSSGPSGARSSMRARPMTSPSSMAASVMPGAGASSRRTSDAVGLGERRAAPPEEPGLGPEGVAEAANGVVEARVRGRHHDERGCEFHAADADGTMCPGRSEHVNVARGRRRGVR